MDKYTETYGVDISKDYFDVYSEIYGHERFDNDAVGFHELLGGLPNNARIVMESTGYYHIPLADFLLDHELVVYVVNPLSVKRFVQMRLSKVKTDKRDAAMIREYALNVDLIPYKGQSPEQKERLQLSRLLDVYLKQKTMFKNKLHGEQVLGEPSAFAVDSLKASLKMVKQQIGELEKRLEALVKKDFGDELGLLKSIPGIGQRTALYLLIKTEGFSLFDNASQLVSYAGISPIIRESGSSVRGRARISKMGDKKLRNLLFMCAFNACDKNPGCKALFDRLVNKGKSKKLALVAVGNKLLRQAFAVAVSGRPFDPHYRSVRAA